MAISPNHLPLNSTTGQEAFNNNLLTIQVAIINQIAQVIRGTMVLDEVLQTIAHQLRDTLQVNGCLILQADESQLLAIAVHSATTIPQEAKDVFYPSRLQGGCPTGTPTSSSEGASGLTLTEKTNGYLESLEVFYRPCREFSKYYHSWLAQGKLVLIAVTERQLPLMLRDAVRECGLSSILIVPLLHRQSYIGNVTLYQCEQKREWTPQEIAFVQAIADQCAIALALKKLDKRYQTELKKRQESESARRELQRRLRAICNQTCQFIGLLTPEGIVVEVNQTALDFAGLKEQDIVGRPFWEVQWWIPTLNTHRRLQEAIATSAAGQFIQYEVNVLGKSAQRAILDFSLTPHRDESGQVVLLIFEGRDITDYKRAQSALQESVARNKAVLEAIPDEIFRVTRDGIYLDWKASKEEALLVLDREILGRHLHQVLPKQVAGLIWHHVELALETNEIQILEYQLRLNGKFSDFEARLVKSGLDEVVVIVQDITERVQARVALQQVNNALEMRVEERTAALSEVNHILRAEIIERKKAEQQLRNSEERFRQAVVNAPFPIMIHAEDGEVIQINQVWTDLTGYTHPEIPTIADWAEKAYGERQEIVRSLSDKLYDLNDQGDQGELAVATKEGATRIWHFRSAPSGRLSDGRHLTISMATDITERKQAEKEVRFLHSVAQAIFESQDFHAALNVALQKVCEATGWDFGEAWVPRADGSFLDASSAWYTKSEGLDRFRSASTTLTFAPGMGLPGRVWLSKQPEWRRDVSGESNEVYLRSQLAKEVGLKAGLGIPILTTDGVLAVLVFYMFESQDQDERLIELISASTELGLMIQRKQAEGEIRKALEKEKELTELKSRFISMTSHEFRTPLTTIQSSAELLERYSQKWTPERKLTHLHRIQTSVKHMTKLLNDVLIIGKAEAGKLKLTPAPLELEKFCGDLVEELQLNDTNQHAIAFTCGCALETGDLGQPGQGGIGNAPLSSKFPILCMDEKLLRQILENLLSNAIKYSPTGSTVDFTLSCFSDRAIFQIRDRGIGIPAEDQQRLFETFHRAANVGTIAGTGLGLAIVKKCVDIHQGQVVVESEIGVGTTFTVTLPILGMENLGLEVR